MKTTITAMMTVPYVWTVRTILPSPSLGTGATSFAR